MKKLNAKKKKEYFFVVSFLIYPLLLFSVFYIGVNANSILLAFQDITIRGETSFAGLKHFQEFFRDIAADPLVKTGLTNSLKLYAYNLLISFPLGILFSYVIYKRFVGHKIVRFIVLLPQIISSFVICLLFKKFVESAFPNIMQTIGFENFPNLIGNRETAFGTIVFYGIWISFSGVLIVYPNAMNEIPAEIIESAQIDGVDNMFSELRYMILPLIFPTISTFLITGVAGIFLTDGNLISFFMYSATGDLYNMGYYFTVKVLTGTTVTYPYLSAAGLSITLIIAPITYLVKFLLEKFSPETEY